MAGNHNIDVDPDYQEKSEKFWGGFVVFVKYSIYIIIAVLGLMALFLL